MPLVEFATSALATLFVVIDPIGLAPAFVAITHGLPARSISRIGLRAALIAALILIGTALAGNWVLYHLGIGLPAFRIAGGLLLFAVAFEMVLGVRPAREVQETEQAIEERVRNIAAFPLATPLMAGPGAMTATLLLAGRASADMMGMAILIGCIIAIAALCALVFITAGSVARFLGTSGNAVLSRVLGVVLAALALQFVIDGIRAAIG